MKIAETKPIMPVPMFSTLLGQIILGDSLDYLRQVPSNSVNLIFTSPPYGLVTKKEYGNVASSEYVDWFRPFGREFMRILRPDGSLVIEIGGSWNKGAPTKSLYHFELAIDLCKTVGFHLAQDFYHYNTAKLPGPAAWTCIKRLRVKDAVNMVWWLSKTEHPKANNRKILTPFRNPDFVRVNRVKSPSGHTVSFKLRHDLDGAIPPNLLAISNTSSNTPYIKYCRKHGLKVHPARMPEKLAEFFVAYLTDPDDLVIDPFAGSCVTGVVCEEQERRWVCVDLCEEYLKGAIGRFSEYYSKEPADNAHSTVESKLEQSAETV